jgi:hypothetical protein
MGGVSYVTAFVFGMAILASLLLGTLSLLISLNSKLINYEYDIVDDFNPYKLTRVSINDIKIFADNRKVHTIEFNLTNLGYMPISFDELNKIDLIIKYVKNVGKGKRVVLQDRVLRVPYDSSCTPSSTCWRLDDTEPVYNDKINIVNVNEEYGLIDKGEKAHIIIYFTINDSPYYDEADSYGYFVFVVALKDGEIALVSVIDPNEVIS